MKHLNYFFLIKMLFFYFVGFSQGSKSNEKEIAEYFEKQNKSNQIESKIEDSLEINHKEKILLSQLKIGFSKDYTEVGVEIPKDEITIDDINVLSNINKKLLLSNGFLTISNENFKHKIRDIFDRVIDTNSEKKYLYVDYFNKCNRKFSYKPNDGINYNGIYIDKENKIITDFYFIPELIDYQKEFPNCFKKELEMDNSYLNSDNEKVTITFWKDIENNKDLAISLKEQRKKNIQTLVARNMYLFNDSKAHFKWLILNDTYFMESLVVKFGYYKDKELIKWVIEGNIKFDDDNPEALDQLFWNKKCDGTVKLNLEIFPVLKEIITPKEVNYLEALKMYVMYLLDEEKRKELSLKDRAKLLAHLVSFGEQYRYNSNFKDKSYFMQRIELYDIKGDIKKEIIKNNYYNLPNYQNLYKKSEEYQDALADENGG